MKKSEFLKEGLNSFISVLLIYVFCFAFRMIEYFSLRTDQSFFGEAFIHKLIGINVLIVATLYFGYRFSEIGFKTGRALFNILKGLGFGIAVFIVAYGVEILIAVASGEFKGLSLYVSAYSPDGNSGKRTDLIFFLICIVGNAINVLMEEGVFRGLFQKLLGEKYKFTVAAVIASLFFGVWHIVSPLRSFIDGDSSLGGFIANACLLVGTSALVGFKFALMGRLTGDLYMAMGDHFVNNTLVNILHVMSNDGADNLQTIRITIAQSVSFIAVLVWFLILRLKKKKEEKEVLTEVPLK